MMKLEQIPAYELLKQEKLDDIQSMAYVLRHKKSGAHLCILENDDENKVFNIAFRTPAPDSTGVPHIMEHSVLCGSKNFPAKDPFVELVKGSLNTFLNAMTYPDRTLYPVASMNQKDFQNLMHVYLDAVLYPKIYEREEIFLQEGWSYHLEEPDGKLTYNGVVYNEMKGAFSSADGVLSREILAALYPNTTYANESGGNPENIPELTYEAFLDFHRTYYHPTNSYLYLYGDMDMEEKLNWLDKEYLSEFDILPVNVQIGEQKPFDKPHSIVKEYPIAESEKEEEHTYLSYNVSIGESWDETRNLAWEILEYALISTPGAPLKKALIDAGIGKEVNGSFEDDMKYSFFSIIAKHTQEDKTEEFVQIIENTLETIVKDGLDKKTLEAAINFLEFQYREADFGRFPKGIMAALQIYAAWNYDAPDIFMNVKRSSQFAYFKEQIGTGYFEEFIQRCFLDNPHKAMVTLRPKRGLATKQEEAIAKKLAAYQASLSKEQITELVNKTKRLEEFQEEPTSKEDLEKIPMLTREDIEKKAAPYYLEEKESDGIKILHHNLATNGIGYLTLVFLANRLPQELVPYMGLLKTVLGYIDTKNYTYGELFNEINRYTGGIQYGVTMYGNKKAEEGCIATFEIKAKALLDKQEFVMDMIKEVLLTSKISDTKRLKEIVDELKSRIQSSITSSGHSTALVRGLSYISPVQYYSDMTSGVAFYQFIKEISEHFEEKKGLLVEKLEEVVRRLFTPKNLLVSYTSDDIGYEQMPSLVGGFSKCLYEDYGDEPSESAKLSKLSTKNEGFKTSSQVQYVARIGNFAKAGYSYTGTLKILSVIMNYEYMWVNIRVKGGAYGCMSGFFRNGDSYFVSYRDPNLETTNDVFNGIAEFIENFTVDERDMTKYIIGTISDIDAPLTPKTKGIRSLTAYMMGVTYDMIQEERDAILNATQESIRELAPRIRAVLEEQLICAVGNEEKIESSKLFLNKVNIFE